MTKIISEETVSNAAVLDLLETCRSLGVINEAQLTKLQIDPSTLNNPTLRFSEHKLIELWQWIAEHSAQPNIGLLIGQTINPSAKGLLASWVSQTESIGEALDIFCTHISLMNPSEHWDIHVERGLCTLEFTLQEDKGYPAIAIERSMCAMMTWGRNLSGTNFPLTEALFSFPTTHYPEHFECIFGQNISFNHTKNGLIFDSKYLKLPIITGNQFLKSMIEDKAKAALHDLASEQSNINKTKRAIEKVFLNRSAISIDAVCDELAMSRQTLYRKLKEEGADYKSLSDDYKKAEALKLLKIKSETIASISFRLGFKDTSSFYKAFKRWFESSPKAYLSNLDQ